MLSKTVRSIYGCTLFMFQQHLFILLRPWVLHVLYIHVTGILSVMIVTEIQKMQNKHCVSVVAICLFQSDSVIMDKVRDQYLYMLQPLSYCEAMAYQHLIFAHGQQIS